MARIGQSNRQRGFVTGLRTSVAARWRQAPSAGMGVRGMLLAISSPVACAWLGGVCCCSVVNIVDGIDVLAYVTTTSFALLRDVNIKGGGPNIRSRV